MSIAGPSSPSAAVAVPTAVLTLERIQNFPRKDPVLRVFYPPPPAMTKQLAGSVNSASGGARPDGLSDVQPLFVTKPKRNSPNATWNADVEISLVAVPGDGTSAKPDELVAQALVECVDSERYGDETYIGSFMVDLARTHTTNVTLDGTRATLFYTVLAPGAAGSEDQLAEFARTPQGQVRPTDGGPSNGSTGHLSNDGIGGLLDAEGATAARPARESDSPSIEPSAPKPMVTRTKRSPVTISLSVSPPPDTSNHGNDETTEDGGADTSSHPTGGPLSADPSIGNVVATTNAGSDVFGASLTPKNAALPSPIVESATAPAQQAVTRSQANAPAPAAAPKPRVVTPVRLDWLVVETPGAVPVLPSDVAVHVHHPVSSANPTASARFVASPEAAAGARFPLSLAPSAAGAAGAPKPLDAPPVLSLERETADPFARVVIRVAAGRSCAPAGEDGGSLRRVSATAEVLLNLDHVNGRVGEGRTRLRIPLDGAPPELKGAALLLCLSNPSLTASVPPLPPVPSPAGEKRASPLHEEPRKQSTPTAKDTPIPKEPASRGKSSHDEAPTPAASDGDATARTITQPTPGASARTGSTIGANHGLLLVRIVDDGAASSRIPPSMSLTFTAADGSAVPLVPAPGISAIPVVLSKPPSSETGAMEAPGATASCHVYANDRRLPAPLSVQVDAALRGTTAVIVVPLSANEARVDSADAGLGSTSAAATPGGAGVLRIVVSAHLVRSGHVGSQRLSVDGSHKDAPPLPTVKETDRGSFVAHSESRWDRRNMQANVSFTLHACSIEGGAPAGLRASTVVVGGGRSLVSVARRSEAAIGRSAQDSTKLSSLFVFRPVAMQVHLDSSGARIMVCVSTMNTEDTASEDTAGASVRASTASTLLGHCDVHVGEYEPAAAAWLPVRSGPEGAPVALLFVSWKSLWVERPPRQAPRGAPSALGDQSMGGGGGGTSAHAWNRLRLDVIETTGLLVASGSDLGGAYNPYVVVRLIPVGASSDAVSPSVAMQAGQHSVAWDFAVDMPIDARVTQGLLITVMDRDDNAADAPIGFLALRGDAALWRTQEGEGWFPLVDGGSAAASAGAVGSGGADASGLTAMMHGLSPGAGGPHSPGRDTSAGASSMTSGAVRLRWRFEEPSATEQAAAARGLTDSLLRLLDGGDISDLSPVRRRDSSGLDVLDDVASPTPRGGGRNDAPTAGSARWHLRITGMAAQSLPLLSYTRDPRTGVVSTVVPDDLAAVPQESMPVAVSPAVATFRVGDAASGSAQGAPTASASVVGQFPVWEGVVTVPVPRSATVAAAEQFFRSPDKGHGASQPPNPFLLTIDLDAALPEYPGDDAAGTKRSSRSKKHDAPMVALGRAAVDLAAMTNGGLRCGGECALELAPRDQQTATAAPPVPSPGVLGGVATLGIVTFRWDLVPSSDALTVTPQRWAAPGDALDPTVAIEALQARLQPHAVPSRDAQIVVSARLVSDDPALAGTVACPSRGGFNLGVTATGRRTFAPSPLFDGPRMVFSVGDSAEAHDLPLDAKAALPGLLPDSIVVLTVKAVTRQFKEGKPIGHAALALRQTRARAGKVWLRLLSPEVHDVYGASTLAHFALDGDGGLGGESTPANGLIELAWGHNFSAVARSISSGSATSGSDSASRHDESDRRRSDATHDAASFHSHHHDRSNLDASNNSAGPPSMLSAGADSPRLLVTVVQLRDVRPGRLGLALDSDATLDGTADPLRVRVMVGCGRRSARTAAATVVPQLSRNSLGNVSAAPFGLRIDEGFEFAMGGGRGRTRGGAGDDDGADDASAHDLRVQLELDGHALGAARLALTGAVDIGYSQASFKWLPLRAIGGTTADVGGEILVALRFAAPRSASRPDGGDAQNTTTAEAPATGINTSQSGLRTPRGERFGVQPGGSMATPERRSRGRAASPQSPNVSNKHVSFRVSSASFGRGGSQHVDRASLLSAIAGWKLQVLRCSGLPPPPAIDGEAQRLIPNAFVELEWQGAVSCPAASTSVVPDSTDPFFGETYPCLLPEDTTADNVDSRHVIVRVYDRPLGELEEPSSGGCADRRRLIGTAQLAFGDMIDPPQGSTIVALSAPTPPAGATAHKASSKSGVPATLEDLESTGPRSGTVEIAWDAIDAFDDPSSAAGAEAADMPDNGEATNASAVGSSLPTPRASMSAAIGVLRLQRVPQRLQASRLSVAVELLDAQPRGPDHVAGDTTSLTTAATSKEVGFIVGQYFDGVRVYLARPSSAALARVRVLDASTGEVAMKGELVFRAQTAFSDRTLSVDLVDLAAAAAAPRASSKAGVDDGAPPPPSALLSIECSKVSVAGAAPSSGGTEAFVPPHAEAATNEASNASTTASRHEMLELRATEVNSQAVRRILRASSNAGGAAGARRAAARWAPVVHVSTGAHLQQSRTCVPIGSTGAVPEHKLNHSAPFTVLAAAALTVTLYLEERLPASAKRPSRRIFIGRTVLDLTRGRRGSQRLENTLWLPLTGDSDDIAESTTVGGGSAGATNAGHICITWKACPSDAAPSSADLVRSTSGALSTVQPLGAGPAAGARDAVELVVMAMRSNALHWFSKPRAIVRCRSATDGQWHEASASVDLPTIPVSEHTEHDEAPGTLWVAQRVRIALAGDCIDRVCIEVADEGASDGSGSATQVSRGRAVIAVTSEQDATGRGAFGAACCAGWATLQLPDANPTDDTETPTATPHELLVAWSRSRVFPSWATGALAIDDAETDAAAKEEEEDGGKRGRRPRFTAFAPIIGVSVAVRPLRGIGLIPRDADFLSDPYAVTQFQGAASMAKTPHVSGTLAPDWSHQAADAGAETGGSEARSLVAGGAPSGTPDSAAQGKSSEGGSAPAVAVAVYDHDADGEDDFMGQVVMRDPAGDVLRDAPMADYVSDAGRSTIDSEEPVYELGVRLQALLPTEGGVAGDPSSPTPCIVAVDQWRSLDGRPGCDDDEMLVRQFGSLGHVQVRLGLVAPPDVATGHGCDSDAQTGGHDALGGMSTSADTTTVRQLIVRIRGARRLLTKSMPSKTARIFAKLFVKGVTAEPVVSDAVTVPAVSPEDATDLDPSPAHAVVGTSASFTSEDSLIGGSPFTLQFAFMIADPDTLVDAAEGGGGSRGLVVSMWQANDGPVGVTHLGTASIGSVASAIQRIAGVAGPAIWLPLYPREGNRRDDERAKEFHAQQQRSVADAARREALASETEGNVGPFGAVSLAVQLRRPGDAPAESPSNASKMAASVSFGKAPTEGSSSPRDIALTARGGADARPESPLVATVKAADEGPNRWTVMLVPRRLIVPASAVQANGPAALIATGGASDLVLSVHAAPFGSTTKAHATREESESEDEDMPDDMVLRLRAAKARQDRVLDLRGAALTVGPLEPTQDAVTISAELMAGTRDAHTTLLVSAAGTGLAALLEGKISEDGSPRGPVQVPLKRKRHAAAAASGYADPVEAVVEFAFVVSDWRPIAAPLTTGDTTDRPVSPAQASPTGNTTVLPQDTTQKVPQRRLLDPRAPQSELIAALPQYTPRMLLHDAHVLHAAGAVVEQRTIARPYGPGSAASKSFFDPSAAAPVAGSVEGRRQEARRRALAETELRPTMGHTASLVGGSVWILGGVRSPDTEATANGQPATSASLYATTARRIDGADGPAPRWSVMEPAVADGAFTFQREGHSAVVYGGGVIVHGGIGPGGLDRHLTSLSGTYHPSAGSAGSAARRNGGALSQPSASARSVYVVGTGAPASGSNAPSTIADVSAIPTTTGSHAFRSGTRAGGRRTISGGSSGAETAVPSGYFDTTFEYSPARNEWRRVETSHGAGRDYTAEHSAVVLTPNGPRGGSVMAVFGGWTVAVKEVVDVDATGVETHRFTTTERRTDRLAFLDLQSGAWSTVSPTVVNDAGVVDESPAPGPEPRSGHSATVVGDGRYMVVHGGVTKPSDSDGRLRMLSDTWVFDGAALTWREIVTDPSMPRPLPRHGHSTATFGGSIVVFGGRVRGGGGSGRGGPSASADGVWQLDVATEMWRVLPLRGIHRGFHDDDGGDRTTDDDLAPTLHSTRPRYRATVTMLPIGGGAGNRMSRVLRRIHHPSSDVTDAGASGGDPLLMVPDEEHEVCFLVLGGIPSGAPANADTTRRAVIDDLARDVADASRQSRGDGTSAVDTGSKPQRKSSTALSACGPPVILRAAALVEPLDRDGLVAVPQDQQGSSHVGFSLTGDGQRAALESERARRKAESRRQQLYFDRLARPPKKRHSARSATPQGMREAEPLTAEQHEGMIKRLVDDDLKTRKNNELRRERQRQLELTAITGGETKKTSRAKLDEHLEKLHKDAAYQQQNKVIAQKKMWREWRKDHTAPPPPKPQPKAKSKAPAPAGDLQAPPASQNENSVLPAPVIVPLPPAQDDRIKNDDRRKVVALRT